jgi:hypothetical protein
MAFLLLLVPSEQKDTSLPSLARQLAGSLIIRDLKLLPAPQLLPEGACQYTLSLVG